MNSGVFLSLLLVLCRLLGFVLSPPSGKVAPSSSGLTAVTLATSVEIERLDLGEPAQLQPQVSWA